MVSDATVMVAVFLLILGVVSIALAAFLAVYSSRAKGARGAALAVVGGGAWVALAYVLRDLPWEGVWDEVLWPLLLVGTAASAGLLTGAALVYMLIAAR
jgi:hypothetical protein